MNPYSESSKAARNINTLLKFLRSEDDKGGISSIEVKLRNGIAPNTVYLPTLNSENHRNGTVYFLENCN